MPSPRRPSEEHDALEQVVLACQRALAAYRSGLMDEEEFRTALRNAGLVLGDGAASTPKTASEC